MKEYSIKLRLTATEAEQLVKAAAHHDQKVSELLESFVYDLVASDEHRGGDDETEAAHQWYQRRNEALYPHHTPLTETEALQQAETDAQKCCIQEAFRYTPLYFEWIKATMVEDGVIMEDQDHECVYFSIDGDGGIEYDGGYGNSCNDMERICTYEKISWKDVETRLRSYTKEHQQELQYHLRECFKRLPKQDDSIDYVQIKMTRDIYRLEAMLREILGNFCYE